jgi:hypothetical protein
MATAAATSAIRRSVAAARGANLPPVRYEMMQHRVDV